MGNSIKKKKNIKTVEKTYANKSAKYWATREVQEREKILNRNIKKTEIEVAKAYKESANRITKDMEALYDKIIAETKGGNDALVSHLYKYDRYYEMLTDINEKLTELNSKESVILRKRFKKLYEQNTKKIAEQLSISPNIDIDTMTRIVQGVWCEDGLNWADRLGKNKELLIQSLEEKMIDTLSGRTTLTQAVYGEYDPIKKQLVNDIATQFGVSYYQIRRLINTEMAHIYNESTFEKYKEAGIEEYMFLTSEDEKTCSKCVPLDTKIFKMEDKETGVNYPPIHPNCRCTTIAVVD